MEFVGENGAPAKQLLESEIDENDYSKAIEILKDLYKKANLVHGDYSEYNIFKTEKGLVLFDLGSAIDTRHPNTEEFLKRDINNITRFFSKRGIEVNDPEDVFQEIVS